MARGAPGIDVLIRGGLVYDGSGRPPEHLDVAIADGKVASVGRLDAVPARRVIDAAGRAVMPGLIDAHTHSDYTLFVHGQADSAVLQGVTTHVAGNCGYSCAPIFDPGLAPHLTLGFEPSVGLAWTGMGEYFEALEGAGLSINVACLVGHGAVRAAAMGLDSRPATADELARMRAVLAEALDEGAVGLSTGLGYPPGNNADAAELASLCEVVVRRGKVHASHIRNRDVAYEAGFREILELTDRTGVPLQVSHLATKYGAPPAATQHALKLVEQARARGHDVACDMLVDEWGPGQLTSFLQPWAFEGGIEQTLARLADPAVRPRLRQPNPSWRMALDPDQYDRLVICRADRTPELVGRSFAELAANSGKDFHEIACEVLLANGEELYSVWILGRAFEAEDVLATLARPYCMPASDDLVAAPYGILRKAALGPACYGWAAQFFGEWVRERRVFSPEEAVRKLTALPARRFDLRGRGALEEGYWADVVVMDLARVATNATLADFARHPSGIEHVLVNGEVVVQAGRHTGATPGRVLRG